MTAIPASQVPDAPMQAAPPTDRWESRIVGHGEESPDQLMANPRNWRIHPKRQQDALSEVLDRVGWVQSVIVNQQTGNVVDGHLRIGLAISRREPTVPVAYVDLTPDEEALVLASLDPIAGLAATDEGALKGLLADLEGQLDGELGQLMASLTKSTGSVSTPLPTQQDVDDAQAAADTRFNDMSRGRMHDVTCPGCGAEFAVNLDEVTDGQ